MKDLGEAKQYLGIEIEYNKAERKMTLSQQRYIESLAKKYGVIESKKYNTPMEMNLKLMPAEQTDKNHYNLRRQQRSFSFSQKWIKPELATTIYEDNSGALALAKNGNFSQNSKHIGVSYHFVHDYEKKGEIKVEKISTDDQLADIFTKALGKNKFYDFRKLLGLYEINEN
ncbi:hypothetical protein QE152_g9995 [Popillia japonica]|uniref:Reverse transcriptase Ty1/copia-type domain-containing protein n=1 Tax=Popillia japonica TaxID=7064 RepID=A0AAW1LVT6_POPJA